MLAGSLSSVSIHVLLFRSAAGLRLRSSGLCVERNVPAMYDLLVVVVALVTFVALGAFVYFCEQI
jgi:hypothetical protein